MTDERQAYELQRRRYNFLHMWTRRYNHMKYRNMGVTTNKSHAAGKDIMTREEFFEWCKKPEVLSEFMALYYDWVNSDFELELCPSVDRIHPDLGYVEGNLQWLSFSDNCSKNHKYVDYRGIMVREIV